MGTIQTWYEMVLQQMAAEAYLDGFTDYDAQQALLLQRLQNGNNQDGYPFAGLTRMSELQAQYFVDNFRIVDHLGNDDPRLTQWKVAGTGFSATLIQKRDANGNLTNEYTLSFRSTEYQNQSNGGDWERDGYNGADGEVFNYGFAFAQIAAMEKYYEYLKSTPGLLPAGATLNVTGYSLGAHLATVFTQLHWADVNHAYTFNAAGMGGYDAAVGSLNEILDSYRAVYDHRPDRSCNRSVSPSPPELACGPLPLAA